METAAAEATVGRFRHVPALDGLRGLAVLAVLGFHGGFYRWFSGGFLGVDVFFVLSGYLITSLLLLEHERTGRIAFGRFYARRALRLLPAMIVTIAIALSLFAIFDPPGEEPFSATLRGAIGGVLYFSCWLAALGIDVGHFGHTWSLAVEEHFYLAWPALMAIALRGGRRPQRFIFAAFLVAVAYRVALSLAGVPKGWLLYAPDARAEQLLAGCALAAWLCLAPPLDTPRRRALIGAAAIVALASLGTLILIARRSIVAAPGVSTAVSLASAALILELRVAPVGVFARVLSWAPLVWLGRRSYGLYLWHVPIFGLVVWPARTRYHVVGEFATRVFLSLIATALSYRCIEEPFLRMKGRFAAVR